MYSYISLTLKECKCINNYRPFEVGMVYDCFELPKPEYDWRDGWNGEKTRRMQYCVIYRKNGKNYYVTYQDYEFNYFFTILEPENNNEQIETKVEKNNDNINIYR